MALPEYPVIDVEDYLTLDRHSKENRYEYLDGELVMLAGGSNYHSRIIANVTIAIGRTLTNSACNIFNSDIRLQLSETRYVHPDVTVSCDPRDNEPNEMIRYPRLVIEVLSPSTEAIDKIKKLAYYQECPTIQEYVMIDSLSIHIEVYHREEDGWKYHIYGPASAVKLESLDIQFAIEDIYKGMKLSGTRSSKNT